MPSRISAWSFRNRMGFARPWVSTKPGLKMRSMSFLDFILGIHDVMKNTSLSPLVSSIALRLKGITTDANLADLKDELDNEAMQLRADIPILPHMPSIFQT